jgi:hypothetical protein
MVRAGGPRPVSYQWRKSGIGLPSETNASLTITNFTQDNRGLYEVVVSDGVTSCTTTANLSYVHPVITQQPESIVSSAGQTVSLTVAAIGVPPLAYQWFQDNVLLRGATNATLLLTNVTSLDAGAYYVRVMSEASLLQTAYSSLANITVVNNGPASPPLLETPLHATSGILQFRFVTELGRAYEVQFTPSLIGQASWTVVQTVRGNGESILITVPGGTSQGYYRAKVIP